MADGVGVAAVAHQAQLAQTWEEEGHEARAQGAQDALEQQRPSSLQELVGSDAMPLVLAFLGAVGAEADGRSLAQALALGRVLPGVCVASRIRVGPAGARLLQADACLCELRLLEGSSWAHVFAALKQNTGLRKLCLRNCGLIKPRQELKVLADAVAVNGGLAELTLSGNDLSKGGGRHLAALLQSATLRVLRMRDLRGMLRGAGATGVRTLVAALACTSGLRELALGDNCIDEATGHAMAAALTTNSSLRKLEFSVYPMLGNAQEAIVRSLLVNHTLVDLALLNTALGGASGAALAEVLRVNSSLRALDLSGKGRRGRPGRRPIPAQVLAALEHNVGLQVLKLGYCRLTADHGLALARSLLERPGGLLRELDVSYNEDIGDRACSLIIGASLKPGSALRALNLCCTGMGHAACHSLAGKLPTNSTLARLEFSGILEGGEELEADAGADSERGWREVFASLEKNVGLRELELRNCALGDADYVALAHALASNNTLRSLAVRFMHISEHGAKCVAGAISLNKGLRALVFQLSLHSDCKLDADSSSAFANALCDNTTLRYLDLRFTYPKHVCEALTATSRCCIEVDM